MSEKLEKAIALARDVVPTVAEREAQRRSFAYGNAHLANDRITRETVALASDSLSEMVKTNTD